MGHCLYPLLRTKKHMCEGYSSTSHPSFHLKPSSILLLAASVCFLVPRGNVLLLLSMKTISIKVVLNKSRSRLFLSYLYPNTFWTKLLFPLFILLNVVMSASSFHNLKSECLRTLWLETEKGDGIK